MIWILDYDQVNQNAPWDIKRDNPRKQQFGDIRMPDYGGVSTKGLKNIFSEELRDASAYYGDSKEDHEAIKKGIDFYYEDYPNAKPGINRTIP